MIVTTDSGCIFSKCSISYVLCMYRKWAYCIKYTYCKTSMSNTVVHHCDTPGEPLSECIWVRTCLGDRKLPVVGFHLRIDIQNQKLLFELAGPQGEHWHVLFLTQWHLHTLLPNAIHLPDISPSRFHYSPHHFSFSCFQISHSFLAIRPFPFLFSITPYVPVTLFISPRFPPSLSHLWCGAAAANW